MQHEKPQSSNAEALVRLTGAGVRRGGRWLVEGIDLDLTRGHIVTLIGPNGSGKSTTAKMALGILSPDAGSVWRRPGLKVGYVPQKLAIDWTLPMTVGRLMHLTGHHGPAETRTALEKVGIGHLSGASVQTLSGGEFQRALLARAMLRQPDLLVLDEPVQGVDYAGEQALYALIRQIRDETGCGILLISHDLHVVMADTDTVICLNGHVCCRGAPEHVAQSAEYAALFGTQAALMPAGAAGLALYQHHHDHMHLPDGRVRHADGSITEGHEDHSGHAHLHTQHPDHDHGHGHAAAGQKGDVPHA